MNCIIIDGEKKSRVPLEKMIARYEHITLVASCDSTALAADEFLKHKIDVLLIDALVPPINDLRLLYYLKFNKPYIIIISRDKKEATKAALNSSASDILLKPVSYQRLMKALNKVVLAENNVTNSSADHSFVLVKVDRSLEKIATGDIHFVQALADYVRIHTPQKVHTTYSTMKAMLNKLPKKDFMQVHRSYIVRVESISEFREGFLYIEQHLIPIGKLYKKELMERLNVM